MRWWVVEDELIERSLYFFKTKNKIIHLLLLSARMRDLADYRKVIVPSITDDEPRKQTNIKCFLLLKISLEIQPRQ